MEPPSYDYDYLLHVTGSDFSLNTTQLQSIANAGDKCRKLASMDHLLPELFNGNTPEPYAIEVDIVQDFANENKSDEEKLRQSPALDVGERQQQNVTSVALTLERPVQMTQKPQDPPREGTTRESMPHLPGELLHSQMPTTHPSLAVFRFCTITTPSPHQQDLRILDPMDIDDVLNPAQDEVLTESSFESLQIKSPLLVDTPSPSAETPSLKVKTKRLATSMGKRPASITDDAGVELKVNFIENAVKRYHGHGAAVSSNGKVQVHEVVMVLLLAEFRDAGLANILSFCTEEGLDTGSVSDNFVARDTKTMGLIWQKIKGNKNGNYDTFARAMRVGRERQKQFFDYLDAGKGAKKRIYKLGPKCRQELDRMKRALVQLRSGV